MDDIVTLLCASNKKIQTTRQLLQKHPNCLFATLLQTTRSQSNHEGIKLNCLERDGSLIIQIVNALRHPEELFVLPDDYSNWENLIEELRYWQLDALEKKVTALRPAPPVPSTILIAYHGTLTFGKQGFSADVNFRKIHRILVTGKVSDCKQVFGDSLNQDRDGDMGEDRYTSRVYLKHTFLEQAFDNLAANGYSLITASAHTPSPKAFTHHKDEQECYMHYSQFTFQKT